MASHVRIPPGAVHDVLRRHLLALGYPIVLDLEKSHGAFAVDALSGSPYLDFSSFYGSNPLGYNHPSMLEAETQQRLARAAIEYAFTRRGMLSTCTVHAQAHARTQRVVDTRGGRLLGDLLVPALDRAVPLPQGDHPAVGQVVGESDDRDPALLDALSDRR